MVVSQSPARGDAVKKGRDGEAKREDERESDGVDPLALPLVQRPKGNGETARRLG